MYVCIYIYIYFFFRKIKGNWTVAYPTLKSEVTSHLRVWQHQRLFVDHTSVGTQLLGMCRIMTLYTVHHLVNSSIMFLWAKQNFNLVHWYCHIWQYQIIPCSPPPAILPNLHIIALARVFSLKSIPSRNTWYLCQIFFNGQIIHLCCAISALYNGNLYIVVKI